MYHLSNFLFLRDQSIGAVLEYPKEILYAIFIENVKYDIIILVENFYVVMPNYSNPVSRVLEKCI